MEKIQDAGTLQKLFARFCPFKANGKLVPRNKRRTVLGANTDFPAEIFSRGFVKAASEGRQSPIIVQMSQNCCKKMGNGSIVDGAIKNRFLVERYVEEFGAKKVFISLDHFGVPEFRKLKAAGKKNSSVKEALGFLYGKEAFRKELKEALALEKYFHAYALSQEFKEFRQTFIETIKSVQPALAMVDAGELPLGLNLAVTREIIQGVKEFDKRVLIETGFASCSEKQKKRSARELEEYSKKVVEFIRFTKGNLVSYGIGMRHGARFFKGERFGPDTRKLEAVQRALFKEFRRVVPFAQHGGTGTRFVPLGLSSKINVATYFKAVAMQSLERHCRKNRKEILAGSKKASGTKPYFKASDEVAKAAARKLKQCNSFGAVPVL